MNEKVFLIDCDEVLRQTLVKMLEVYNRHFPDKKKMEDVISFKTEISFPEIEKLTGQTPSHWFFQEHGEEMFLETDPFPHVKEDIETLKQYGKVVVLTYQKTYANKKHTLEWLEKIGIEPDGICFMKDKTLVSGDYLVDDNDWNFRDNEVKYGILIDAPYNKDKSVDDVLRTSHCEKVERFASLHDFVVAYDSAEKAIAQAMKDYDKNGKTYILKKSIPYIETDFYNTPRQFSHEGEEVRICNAYIKGTEPLLVVGCKNSWGSVSVTIDDFKNSIRND